MRLGENVVGKALVSYNNLPPRLEKVHNNKYDYSKVVFTKMSEKVIIICPEHGEFLQSMSAQVAGNGCPKCAFVKVGLRNRLSLDDFKIKASLVHNNRYDYSKAEDFNSTYDKVTIICEKHGEFRQSVDNHLRNRNCPKCNFKYDTEIYIDTVRKIQNDKYTYENLIYTGNKDKLEITCRKHGSFFQRADIHLSGSGCPECSRTITPNEKYKNYPTTFYVIKYKGLYKIGITIIDVLKRYKDDIPDRTQVEILTKETFEGYDKAFMFEQFLKDKYYEYRYFGAKIFKNTGNTEVFTENIYELYLKECADE